MTSLADIREGDQSFVRRCRMLTVGVARIIAVIIAVQAIEGGVRQAIQWSSTVFGPTYPMWVTIISVAMPLVSVAVLWFSAPWIARLAFPMPAGRHQCPKCRYPVKDLDAEACPECGTRIK